MDMTDKEFIEYVYSFYGDGGLYPIATLTRQDIWQAMTQLRADTRHEFCADSFDRELIRDIIMAKLGVV